MAARKKAPKLTPEERLQRHLKGLGFASPAEFALYPPHRYNDYTKPILNLEDALKRGRAMLRVCLESKRFDYLARPVRAFIKVTDHFGNLASMAVFGNVFPFQDIEPGTWIHVSGKVSIYKGYDLSIDGAELIPADHVGHLIPVYRARRGVIAGDAVAKYIVDGWTSYRDTAVQLICDKVGMNEAEIVRQAGLMEHSVGSVRDLLQQLHFPDSAKQAESAYLAARRLGAYHVLSRSRKLADRAPDPASAIGIPWSMVADLVARLPFALTRDQKLAIRDVVTDLNADLPMDRIVLGDVGSGKTAVNLVTAVATQMCGRRVAVLLPNQLLVDQIFSELKAWFPEAPAYKIVSGKKPDVELKANPLLIGTTALLSFIKKHHKDWGTPDLLICDEQQKMSREQREALRHDATNLLETTATCIPRTSALVMYGAKDASIIAEMPVKKDIKTLVVEPGERKRMFATVKKVVAGGGQVAVIYHRVEGAGDDEDSRKSIAAATAMWEKHFPGRVGVIHGKMKTEEQQAVIASMLAHAIDIVVSSTVLETGLTLPSLKALVVMHAERHGLSALHQLRGRVARKGGEGYFLLYLPDQVSDESRARLQLLVDHNDGFTLAQRDMEMRGFGDLSEESNDQAGISKTLFVGIELMPKDLEQFLPAVQPARAAAA